MIGAAGFLLALLGLAAIACAALRKSPADEARALDAAIREDLGLGEPSG